MKYAVIAVALSLSMIQMAVAAPVGGGGCQKERIEADSVQMFEGEFVAGETAYIYIDGDDYTNLDLFVYDADGNLVDFDINVTDEGLVVFTPETTGTFIIEVVNNGNVYNEYTLCAL